MNPGRGYYFGTEIGGKWWRRYRRDGLFARGLGEYRYDDRAFHFRRKLSENVIRIEFAAVEDIRTGRWHAGRWGAGAPVIKFIWKKDDLTLSSGFLLSRNREEAARIIEDIVRRWRATRSRS